jgi:hypothetical protein
VVGQVGAGNGAAVFQNGVALASSAFSVSPAGAVTITTASLAAGDQITVVPLKSGQSSTATVPGYAAVAISGTLPSAAINQAYTFTPTVTGGAGAKSFSFSGTLQPGFSFASSTGNLSGTPTTAATQTGTITVTDGVGAQASLAISITVSTGFVAGTPLYFIGDSITSETYIPLGYSMQLQGKMAGKYVVPPLGNRGSSGAYASDANREASIQNHLGPPGVAIVMLGTNQDPAGFSATTTALRAIYDRMIAAGHKVIAMTPPNTAASRQDTAYILNQTDVTVVPLHSIITSADVYDGTHFNESGVNKTLGQLVPLLNNLSSVASNTAYNIAGTSRSKEFTASGGTVNGTGATGIAPAGWECSQTTGNGTTAFNMVTEDGFPTLEITITGGTQYTEVRLTEFIQPSSGNISDIFDAWFEFKLMSGALANYNHSLQNNFGGSQPNSPYTTLAGYQTFLQWVKPTNTTGGFYNQLYLGSPANTNSVFRVRRPRVIKRTVPNFYARPYTSSGQRPQINGTPKVGSTLTATSQTWWAVPMPVSYAYQWNVNGTPVSGATSTTYVPVSGDVGKVPTCTISVTNGASMVEIFTTAPLAAIAA